MTDFGTMKSAALKGSWGEAGVWYRKRQGELISLGKGQVAVETSRLNGVTGKRCSFAPHSKV